MTAASFPPGIDPEVWEEVKRPVWLEREDDEKFAMGDRGPARYFVRREPTPTMPVLPSEPGAVIRATVLGAPVNMVQIDPGSASAWVGWGERDDWRWFSEDEITAWEPLVTRSEVLEQIGVEERERERVAAVEPLAEEVVRLLMRDHHDCEFRLAGDGHDGLPANLRWVFGCDGGDVVSHDGPVNVRRAHQVNLVRALLSDADTSALEQREREVRAEAVESAADGIQALHPGEIKNSVVWLRDRARAERGGE